MLEESVEAVSTVESGGSETSFDLAVSINVSSKVTASVAEILLQGVNLEQSSFPLPPPGYFCAFGTEKEGYRCRKSRQAQALNRLGMVTHRC